MPWHQSLIELVTCRHISYAPSRNSNTNDVLIRFWIPVQILATRETNSLGAIVIHSKVKSKAQLEACTTT